MQRTIVLVGAVGRSGSTVLDLMLGNRNDARSLGEVSACFRPFRSDHLEPYCACGLPLTQCWAWRGVEFRRARRFHGAFLDVTGTTIAVDSSKSIEWILDVNRWYRGTDVRVRNVLLWKEPKELSFSLWRRGLPVNRWRSRFGGYYGRYLAAGIPFVTVQFDDMASRPRDVLTTLNKHFEFSAVDRQEMFWEREHHHMFGSPTIRWEPYRAVEYPATFEAAWEVEQNELARDSSLTQVLGALREGTPLPSRRWQDSIVADRPVWYWKARGVGAWRQRRPRPPHEHRFRDR